MQPPRFPKILRLVLLVFLAPRALPAAPVAFDLAAQPGDAALLAFAQQAGVDVLFSFDELHRIHAPAIRGEYEPEAALLRLLENSGCLVRRNGPKKYIVTLADRPTGTLRGRLLQADQHRPATGLSVALTGTSFHTTTDADGAFEFASIPPGRYQLTARGQNYRELSLTHIRIRANRLTNLRPQEMQVAGEVMLLEPFVVEANASADNQDPAHGVVPFRIAAGNLDLPRTIDDALAFQIYGRDQLARSGVVNLNDFLQREVLDSNGATALPDLEAGTSGLFNGSANLNLRGYDPEETVILVNGRRLPEILTNLQYGYYGQKQLPDVNFIPLSMVQQIEVLPVSASSLYTGNPVGGVINIVLRLDLEATEVTALYSNATGGFDAPQSTVTFQHGQTLLGGKIRIRLSASHTSVTPATEAELGLIAARNQSDPATDLHRATPNVRSANGDPLFGPGTASFTSVAPGADGTGGFNAFAGRAGVANPALFDAGPGLVTSTESTGFAYGRRQERTTYFGSVIYDILPVLQLGLDVTHSRSIVHPGRNLFFADLLLPAAAAANPFGQDVVVSLNEAPRSLGAEYNVARQESSAIVGGALLKLPGGWRTTLDTQFARSRSRYRGLVGVDTDRWQQLVNAGLYNPLRDTQVSPPPKEFDERVLVHAGSPGRTVTLGDYSALDVAFRLSHPALPIPTGLAAVNLGADYRRNWLSAFTDERRYGDGTLVGTPDRWAGRTLQRWSLFGEMQAPLLPARWLPRGVRSIESDLAVRYIAASTSRESYLSPTVGLKFNFASGLSFRTSITTSNRYPTPHLSSRVGLPGDGTGGVNTVEILDPLRGNERRTVREGELPGFALNPESAVTQTAGLIYQAGSEHRLRATLDFIDTRKTDELVLLNPQGVLALERVFPERVTRAAPLPGDPYPVGRVTAVATGNVNLASRHSQNWNAGLDYAWNRCAGGTLRLDARLVYFGRYERKILPTDPAYDELTAPSGTALGLLRYRANLGAGWSNHRFGFGLAARYYHQRILPLGERAIQGRDHIAALWLFDAHLEGDLSPWLPGNEPNAAGLRRYGLRGQLRVDNLLGTGFPRYSYDATTGVQPYGDWRGRTYSVSLTATF